MRTAVPYAQWCRTPQNHREGDIYRLHHLPHGQILRIFCRQLCQIDPWRKAHVDARVLNRHVRRAKHAQQSPTWRSQGKKI